MNAPASGEASPVEAAAARYPHRDPMLEGGQYLAEERSRQPLREAYVEGWKGCQTRLLAGDWLEWVLDEHALTVEWHGFSTITFVCKCGRPSANHADQANHQAAAVRAAAGVGL